MKIQVNMEKTNSVRVVIYYIRLSDCFLNQWTLCLHASATL